MAVTRMAVIDIGSHELDLEIFDVSPAKGIVCAQALHHDGSSLARTPVPRPLGAADKDCIPAPLTVRLTHLVMAGPPANARRAPKGTLEALGLIPSMQIQEQARTV